MLLLISSAKSQDFSSKFSSPYTTTPMFMIHTLEILKICKLLSKEQIKKLMKINDKIASFNYERFQFFDQGVFKQALAAYNGSVFRNINVTQLTSDHLMFLQNKLYIISGLYGLLRPLDLIQPYRLEMFIKLPNIFKISQFWQVIITQYINNVLSNHKNKYLINLASQEYFSTLNLENLKYPYINIIFKEFRNSILLSNGINSKSARGAMINFVTRNFIDTPNLLKNFSDLGYSYSSNDSNEQNLVFIRYSNK